MTSRTVYSSSALSVLTSANFELMPKGWIGFASEGSPPAISAETDIVSVTVTVPANRMIRITGRGSIIDGDNDSTGGIIFVEEGSTDLGRIHRHPDLAEQSFIGGYVIVDGPSAGSHTYKLVGNVDSNEFTFFGSVDILVEDIGPAS